MDKLSRIASNAEIVTMDELRHVLETKQNPSAYIGFEPSGIVHVGWKVCVNKMRDLTDSGFTMTIFLADWHAYINDKLSGNMDNIRTCGRYMEDCFKALGVDESRTKFIYATELVKRPEYWEKVIKVAKESSLSRVKRAMTIMGRVGDESETDSSKVVYPLMQVADIFELDVDVALGGMDQRKAHMLARDVAEKMGWRKPIAIHTPLLTGLDKGGRMEMGVSHAAGAQAGAAGQGGAVAGTNAAKAGASASGQNAGIKAGSTNLTTSTGAPAHAESKDAKMIDGKMSKSNPNSCIYIHDKEEDIRRKIKAAVCAEGDVEGNPVMDMCRYVIFPQLESFKIERPAKYGGDLAFKTYEEMEATFKAKQLHPMDLKNATSRYLVEMQKPIQAYFDAHPENYEAMKKIKITR